MMDKQSLKRLPMPWPTNKLKEVKIFGGRIIEKPNHLIISYHTEDAQAQ
jgi:hypothetical protein